jgi:type IV secretory pathway VirB2 component (pilin)
MLKECGKGGIMYAVRPLVFHLGAVKSTWARLWLALLTCAITMQAGAQGIDFEGTLSAVPESLCSLFTFLAGPVGFAVVAIVFIIGLIKILSGNRGGLGFVITSFVIGLILVAAPDLLSTFTGTGSCA